MTLEKIKNIHSQKWGLIILRIGLSLVFLYFGTQQLLNPAKWTSFVPDFMSHLSFISATQLVLINGLFETLASLLLILNIFPRLISFLLAIHLFGIATSIGITPVGVRDIGLSIATFSLSLLMPIKNHQASSAM